MNRSLYVAVPLFALLMVLQTSFLPNLGIGAVVPQLALLAAISWALRRGPAEGMVWAFIAGIMWDAFSYSPLGTTSLSLMVAVLAVRPLQQLLPESPYFLPVILTGLVFALYLLLSLILLRLTGHAFSWRNVSLLSPAVLLHGALGLPAYWLATYLDRFLYPRQIEF